MKKNIRILPLDTTFLLWLKKQDIDSNSTALEFSEALKELFDDEIASLVLQREGDADKNDISDNQNIIRSGDLSIFVRERKVTIAGKRVSLTAKEFDILYLLARNRGIVLTKEQIYQAVWEREYLLVDSNIMAFIRKLRKKIEPEPDNPIYILTVWGVGYKFTDD